MTSESHDLPDKYLGITSGGPSAGPVRTVREAVVTDMIWNKCMQVFFGTYSSAADDAGVACFFFRVKNVEAR